MKNRNTVFHLILLLIGILGILTYVFDIEDLICQRQLVVFAAAAPCLLFWSLYGIKAKALPVAVAVLFAGCVLIWDDWILAQIQMFPYFLGCIEGRLYWYMYDMTGFLVCVFGGLSVLLFLTECVLGWHFIMWGLSMALLLSVPITGIDPGWLCIILLGVYQVLFAVVHFGEKAEGSPKVMRKAGGITAGMLAVLLLVSYGIAGSGDGFLYRWAEAIDPTLQQIESEITITVKNRQNVRRINRGNLYTSDTVVMEVRAEEKPTETIYLRDFSGGTYSNGTWLPAADREILNEIDSRADTVNRFINMYYDVNRAGAEKERILYVRRADQDSPSYGIYYGQWHNASWENHVLQAGEEGYAYFEKKDMEPDWDAASTSNFFAGIDENGDNVYSLARSYAFDRERNLHRRYEVAAQKAYTQINRSKLPNLSALQQENPMEGEANITSFIKNYLLTHGTYTDSPGRIPLGKEPVEHFLFESQQGYCQHFASAATLLYRMYGVPARYSMGFAVRPSDFVKKEDGMYYAVVTDEEAHAWPEIFDKELGWTPVEVTPADEEAEGTGAGQQDSEGAGREQKEPESSDKPDSQDGSEKDNRQEQNQNPSGDQEAGSTPLGRSLVALLAAMIAASGVLGRKIYLRSLEKMNCRKAFAKMLEKLQGAGVLSGYDGSEEDFAQKLAIAVAEVSEEEAQRATEIVSRAAFGNTPVSEEEEEAVRQLYRKIAAWAKKNKKIL